MKKGSKLVYLNILVPLTLFVAINFSATSIIRQENHLPVVKIINPKNNSTFDWDTQVNYEISVADKEDGDTKYDELNAKEVLLEVRYAGNKAKVQAILNKGVQNDPPGLAVLRTSNCFNCHNFNSKAIGPSFNEIAVKYTTTASNVDLLVKHIREGSTGIWGKETMPTHPELSAEEVKRTVQWIFKYAKDTDVSYYVGTTGTFRTKLSAAAGKKGVYMLTASYMDHGLKMVKHLKGQDVVVLR
ncbi:c-type cytochrome [Mucilaginibacter sp.]|uniref:c-type cytochrome n=1 Tax=Mucilaginibacter sp. TaxID=1882438 RepID=UPI00260CE37B|nr:c-type cytochrome [Mucilaginibacter sp.]MDB4920120.1 c-type cytochrome [Mucilaginibacter sp.]